MLALQEGSYALMSYLLAHYAVFRRSAQAFKGGLSPLIKQRVMEYLHTHFADEVSLDALAQVAGLSPFHFSRMFKVSLAQAPHQYLNHLRVTHAKRLLLEGKALADIALACGFASQSHFNRAFKQTVGVTPGYYRRVKAF